MKTRPMIYLDNQATTPLDERVLAAMMPYLKESFGNASSTEHRFGWVAEEAVKLAREQIAEALGASPREILFTSGATESNNLAIWGVARAYKAKGNHIITLKTEHKAVLDPCLAWEREGGRVTYLDVQPNGLVDLQVLADAIRDDTILISIMAANNEIGVIQPLAEIGALAREHRVIFHSDATQAVGKLPVNVREQQIDLLSFSAHKIYGPKGMGALYVNRKRPRVVLAPLMYGGGHEQGMRSGTLNVPGIVGLSKALELSLAEMPTEQARLRVLRDRLRSGLEAMFPSMEVNGDWDQRLAGNLNVYFPNLTIADLVREVYGEIAVSTGSACTSASPEPSHVLRALDSEVDRAGSSLRFGIGRFNTEAEIDRVLSIFGEAVALNPLRGQKGPS